MKVKLTGLKGKKLAQLSCGNISHKDENGHVVAEITFTKTSLGIFVINHTFVDESLRGQGVTSKLGKY